MLRRNVFENLTKFRNIYRNFLDIVALLIFRDEFVKNVFYPVLYAF